MIGEPALLAQHPDPAATDFRVDKHSWRGACCEPHLGRQVFREKPANVRAEGTQLGSSIEIHRQAPAIARHRYTYQAPVAAGEKDRFGIRALRF